MGYYNPFRYKGYYYDTESQMYYHNGRYFVSAWGRWLTSIVKKDLINDIIVKSSSPFACGFDYIAIIPKKVSLPSFTVVLPNKNQDVEKDSLSEKKNFGELLIDKQPLSISDGKASQINKKSSTSGFNRDLIRNTSEMSYFELGKNAYAWGMSMMGGGGGGLPYFYTSKELDFLMNQFDI